MRTSNIFDKPKVYNLRIENALRFMQVKYKELTEKECSDIDLEGIDRIDEILIICICKLTNILAMRGLYKEYIKIENVELTSPKGRLNLAESLSKQTNIKGRLICSYEELSGNIMHNKIIKSVLSSSIDTTYSNNTNKIIQRVNKHFNGIDNINIKDIKWKEIKYNNGNLRYKTILNMCKTYIECKGKSTLEQELYLMFKEHLKEFYTKEYKEEYNVESIRIPWNNNTELFEIKRNKTDRLVVISDENKAYIIQCKLYDKNKKQFEIEEDLKNLKISIDEYESEHKIETVGTIIYCNSTVEYRETDIQIANVNSKLMSYTVIDTNVMYKYIHSKLRKLVSYMLIGEIN